MIKKELALDVQHLNVSYGKTPVLWDISLEIPTGNLVGIIGPNGAGKSTFIKAVLGLIPTLSGKVNFFNEPLVKTRQRVAYVPQRESIDWDFPIRVIDLILMGRYGKLGLFHSPKKADYAAAEHYLELVGLKGFSKRQISQLSGGQQQRVFIARALLQEADIYFMDEPFTGIDMATEAFLIDLLKQLKKQGKTVFVVHHDLNTIENYFDWLIMLNMRLVASGKAEDVFNSDNLILTYEKSAAYFDEALRLSQKRTSGKV